jgi:hypothetical protein
MLIAISQGEARLVCIPERYCHRSHADWLLAGRHGHFDSNALVMGDLYNLAGLTNKVGRDRWARRGRPSGPCLPAALP